MIKKILLTVFCLLHFSIVYAGINVEYNDGIYHAIITGDKIKKQIQFVSSSKLITNKEAHNNSDSLFTINTGFFDPKNQKTVSYIVNEYQTVEDPIFNTDLTMNPIIRKNLKAILNRTEFRILDCDDKLKYEIVSNFIFYLRKKFSF